jgi:hypothetical protein
VRYLTARWLRFWHCLLRLHRAEDLWYGFPDLGNHIYVGCECGKVFYAEPGAADVLKNMKEHP